MHHTRAHRASIDKYATLENEFAQLASGMSQAQHGTMLKSTQHVRMVQVRHMSTQKTTDLRVVLFGDRQATLRFVHKSNMLENDSTVFVIFFMAHVQGLGWSDTGVQPCRGCGGSPRNIHFITLTNRHTVYLSHTHTHARTRTHTHTHAHTRTHTHAHARKLSLYNGFTSR